MCHDPRIIFRVPEDKRNSFIFRIQVYLPEFRYLINTFRKQEVLILRLEELKNYQRILDHFAFKDFVFKVPCRKCLGCLADRRNEWASRCLLEAKRYKHNCFVTLTYRDEDCPPCLVRKHYQDFMKRLRERYRKAGLPSPREFYRGEYGERFGRPHFHAIFFNCDFEDKRILWWQKGKRKFQHPVPKSVPYYTSKLLEDCWQHGYVTIAPVCLESIKYVANYLDKGQSPAGYEAPPFHGMSTRPAIAKYWLDERIKDLDLSECMHITSIKLPTSNIHYFRRKVKEQFPEAYDILNSHLRSIAEARPRHWESLGISETEYLNRREEAQRQALQLFGRKKMFESR